MLSGLKAWALEIVAIIILANLLEMMVPFGSQKRYVRMVVGLLILLSVLNPVLRLLDRPEELVQRAQEVWTPVPRDAAVQGAGPPGARSLDDRVRALRAEHEDARARVVRQQLEQRAVRAARSVPGVQAAVARASIDPDTRDAWVEVDYTPAAGVDRGELFHAVRQRLRADLGLPDQSVRIRTKEELP